MTECLIIGSGIVGLVTAYELRKSGYFKSLEKTINNILKRLNKV